MPPFARRLGLSLLMLLALPHPAWSQQKSDTSFDAKVAHPMFHAPHPRLLVDQGHHNTHTTRGRYDALAALASSDGFDVLSISYASPKISAEWHLGPAGLGWVLSMELFGMAAGSLLLGWLLWRS